MRSKHKSWKNGKYPNWTCQITWYEEPEHQNIRLELEDCDGVQNVYPDTKEVADQIWFMFKQGSTPTGVQIPIIKDLLELLTRVKGWHK